MQQINHPQIQGRQILHTEYIKHDGGDFSAYYAAESMLKEMGYSVGSMERQSPIGFAPAEQYGRISKWSHFSREDKLLLHGVMLPDRDFRDGSVVVVFFEPPLVCPIKEIPFKKGL